MSIPAALAALALLLVSSPARVDGADANPRDLVSFGNDIHVRAGESVGRDVFCMGCNITIEADVGRDVVAIGGNVTASAAVGRDAFAIGGNVDLKPGSSVGRDATAVGGRVRVAPGVQVGRGTFSGPFGPGRFHLGAPFFLPVLAAGQVTPTAALVLLGLLLLLLFPRQLEVAGEMLAARPGTSFGLGCLGLVAALPLAILFAITIILLPLSFLVLMLLVAAWAFGWAAIFLLAGSRLLGGLGQPVHPVWALILGGLLLLVVSAIPFISFPILLVAGTLALGAALGSRFGTRPPQQPLFGRGASGGGPGSPPPAQPPGQQAGAQQHE